MKLTFVAGLVLLEVIFLQPPFTANPRDGPELGQHVPAVWRAVPGLETEVTVTADGLLEVTGHVGFQIEDKRCAQSDKFMLGIALAIDGRMVREPSGTQATMNQVRGTHYHDFALSWAVPIAPGTHSVEVLSRAVHKRGHPECRVYFKEGHYHGIVVKVFG